MLAAFYRSYIQNSLIFRLVVVEVLDTFVFTTDKFRFHDLITQSNHAQDFHIEYFTSR